MNTVSNSLVPELSIIDFKKSLDFYTRILGFSIEYQRAEEGFAFLSLGDAQIMIDQIGESRTWQTGEMKHPLGQGINFQIRVDAARVFFDAVHVKIRAAEQVDFVDHHHRRTPEHAGIFERLVIAFGGADEHDFHVFAEIVARRAN